MKARFLDAHKDKYIKFFNKPLEYAYHTLNFLSHYNMPLHYACKSGCIICQINEKIEVHKEVIMERIQQSLGKRPYPEKKIEFIVPVAELIKNFNTEDFTYYWLRLKPRQLLPIVDYMINYDLGDVCSTDDDTLFKIVTGDYGSVNLIEKVENKKWIIYDASKYTELLDELSNLNIFSTLNIISDDSQIKTASYIYGKIIKDSLSNKIGG